MGGVNIGHLFGWACKKKNKNVHDVVVGGKGTKADVGGPQATATDHREEGQPHRLGLSKKDVKGAQVEPRK
jgi:hypothetical protein